MIQDIYPHKLDNHFRPGQTPREDDTVFCFSKERVYCRFDGSRAVFPAAGGLADMASLEYLFTMDGSNFFLAPEGSLEAAGGYDYTELRDLRKRDIEDKHMVFAAVTARHLNDWYRTVRFCGCCGKHLVPSEKERAKVCPSCGRIFYPRINPAVIVAVTYGDNLLLTKYARKRLASYALVAGFAEIGETLEETVQREVMEEVGLKVKNIRYYKSQPWGFSGDMLSGFYCDVDGDHTIRVDHDELKEAVWMPRKEIPGQADDFSLTNEMMITFRDGHA